uniref:Envoplakin n=1 Tax=Oryzias latipes TaxID=8090 RepID=A0A3P9L8L1_ORYLA
MFKKKDTKTPSLKMNSSQTTLAQLIAKMQKDADLVERDVLRAEGLMAVDAENDKKERPLQHQQEVSSKLGEAEDLLKELFLDVDKAKKSNFSQAQEIENDIIHLHERWLKDCTFYRDVYDQIDDVSMLPIIDWGPVFSEKDKQVNTEEYGPTMADVQKQIASHNILHKEIEAYGSQLCLSSAGSKDKLTTLKRQYNNLLDNSKWRHHYLKSLYEYMQGCDKELSFLDKEQKKIIKQDWSDDMVDPPDVRRQYENFKSNSLILHEGEVNKLQDEGDRLIELKHPASVTIQAQRDALQDEWQKFLNLCICQETHLENVEAYRRFQLDTEQLSETLYKLDKSLESNSGSQRSKAATLMQLEGGEPVVQNSDQLLADLRRRSTTIAPLKLRRVPVNRPITVESLCDWETEKDSVSRGDKFTLKSNSVNENWVLVSANGATKTFPGVCFLIPPPDPDSVDKVDTLGNELAGVKKRRAQLAASLKNHQDVPKVQKSAPVSSAPPDPKLTAMAEQLDKLDNDLTKAEEGMLSRLRAPLNKSDPAGDLAQRLKEQEKTEKALKDLEQKRQAAQSNLQPVISKDLNGTSSGLPLKLSAAANKHDSISELAQLYNNKAKASLNLENQIKKVDGLVSGFEEDLSRDGPIPDTPKALQTQAERIHNQRKSVAAAQGDMKKLSQDLETTEQLCGSLQRGYQEYCPDIERQKTDVRQLQTRYANVANQLQERESILQEASAKNQEFQSTCNALNNFLDNLPTNKVNPKDDLSQLTAKTSTQERAVNDLKRKEEEVNRVSTLSHDLQSLLDEYETNVDRFNSTLEDAGATVPKKPDVLTLSDAIEKEEKDLVNRYTKAKAENVQRQKQMGLAQSIIAQNERKVEMVSQQQVQTQSQQKTATDIEALQRELNEEKERSLHAQASLKTFRDRMMSLKSRRGVERLEEKEVLQYYRDPKLERDLSDLKNTLHEEALKRSTVQSEVEVVNKKITTLEDDIKNKPPKLVTREVTEFERDPQLDVEAAKLKAEIAKTKDEIRVKDREQLKMQTEVEILKQKKPPIKEKVVKKEIVKVEQDPQMMKAVQTFQVEISEESNKTKLLHDEVFQTRSQINALERLIPNIQPKIITKEVKKVEQDPELISECKKIQKDLEKEKTEADSLTKQVIELHSRYRDIQNLRPVVEVKEIVNEIYRIDPNTEAEIIRINKNIQDINKQRADLERDITKVTTDVNLLRSEKPKVELKEVLQEVVKEERSPENEREIQRLNEQVNNLHSRYISLQDQVRLLQKERDEWKAEKSKVETKLVTNEVIKYLPDPLQEKEAGRLRKEVREEAQLRRNIEEMVFDLQNKCINLERLKPEEKVVKKKVVHQQKDPQQAREQERLSKTRDDEVKSRRRLEIELQQLRIKLEDKEKILRESDERLKKIQAESEVREIRSRISQLENAPPPVEESIVVEEVLKVERDPKLEKMTSSLCSSMDTETSNILRLERDIRSITLKLEVLQKEKSGERTVYKEVVRVEKDQAVEAERDHLREQVSLSKFERQKLEDEIRRCNDKLNLLKSGQSSTSREETSLVLKRDSLLRDKDTLTREFRTLEAKKHDISLSFQQQNRLMSERTQLNRQKSLKMESDVQRLERQILDEKDKIHERDSTIRELLQEVQREGNSESRTKETNTSTKITILDPETGKDMSPYDAYIQGLIDRPQYLHLQKLESDWEEITSMGPDGETSVLQDRKSGKQYPIKDAIKEGKITEYDLQQYKKGKIPISEFALMLAGVDKKQQQLNSILPKSATPVNSAPLDRSNTEELYPIAGVMDTNTGTCFTISNATQRRLIDRTTAQRLLEAQAATGGIIDIQNKDRYTVHKAANRCLIEESQLQRLLNAEKAFTGVEDPTTRRILSAGEAVQNGWMLKETARRYMVVQLLTGGLVNPKTGGRMSVTDAYTSKMIDSTMMRELQAETTYEKDILDPLTQEKINYKQALDRCKKDPKSGLPMLPTSSKGTGYTTGSNSVKYS